MNHRQLIEAVRRVTSETPPPVPKERIADAERVLKFRLPAILSDLYCEVSNGGFGPGCKVLGVKRGHVSDDGDSLEELYQVLQSEGPDNPQWKWPIGVLPFCHWGCAIYSAVDTTRSNLPVVWFDPNGRGIGDSMDTRFIPHRASIESWFEGWLSGEDLWAETYGDV